MPNQFISRSQFSEAIGVSLSTLIRGIKKDKWPFNAYVKIGGRIRYPAILLEDMRKKALEKQVQQGEKVESYE
jgi:hypothetical protein